MNNARTSGKAVTWCKDRARRIFTSMLFECLSPRFQLARIQEHGHQLIAAFADLATNILEIEVVPIVVKGVLPGSGMQIDGINQRAVHVKDYRFGHNSPPRRRKVNGSRNYSALPLCPVKLRIAASVLSA